MLHPGRVIVIRLEHAEVRAIAVVPQRLFPTSHVFQVKELGVQVQDKRQLYVRWHRIMQEVVVNRRVCAYVKIWFKQDGVQGVPQHFHALRPVSDFEGSPYHWVYPIRFNLSNSTSKYGWVR